MIKENDSVESDLILVCWLRLLKMILEIILENDSVSNVRNIPTTKPYIHEKP